MVASAFLLLLLHNAALPAQTGYTPPIVSRYELLTHLIATDKDAAAIAPKLAASAVDEEGLVGSNSRNDRHSIYPDFLAEEQRGAFSNFTEGILLNDDKNLYIGWQALMATYKRQRPDGNFASPHRGCLSTSCMRFFMAASNQALVLLLESPSANKRPPNSKLTYTQLLQGTGSGDYGLLPKIMAAMDYMVAHATHNSKDPLYTDFGCPNRAMIDSNAYTFGYLLLQKYPPAAEKLTAYDAEGQWWIDDIFVKSNSMAFPFRALADPRTGIFWEGNRFNGYIYDSSYAAVGLARMMVQAYYFQEHFRKAGIDPMQFIKLSGRFLLARISSEDPVTGKDGIIVDTTDDTRTGPIQNPEQGKENDFDTPEARMAMFFYTALFHRPEGVRAISTPTHPFLVFGRPPVIFNDEDILTLHLKHGVPMDSYTVYTTNSGIQQGALQTLDPKFLITADGLPSGLTLGKPHSYPDELHLDQGVGMADVSGTPQKRGLYTVTLKSTNQYGQSQPVKLTIVVE